MRYGIEQGQIFSQSVLTMNRGSNSYTGKGNYVDLIFTSLVELNFTAENAISVKENKFRKVLIHEMKVNFVSLYFLSHKLVQLIYCRV